MGAWGLDNFQCDGALDFVDELVEQLARGVDERFADGRAAPDAEGESHVVPSVAVIIALCERCEARPPDREAVASWREKYLLLFDERTDRGRADAETLALRRNVVAKTFAALERVAR